MTDKEIKAMLKTCVTPEAVVEWVKRELAYMYSEGYTNGHRAGKLEGLKETNELFTRIEKQNEKYLVEIANDVL
jgi:flagellar biosynthesis/type III secretory pathway protein FliH